MNEILTKVDQLSVLAENCIDCATFTIMCEAEGAEDKAKNASKVSTLRNTAIIALKKAWACIIDAIRGLITKIGNLGHNYRILGKDVEVSKYVFVGLPTFVKGAIPKITSKHLNGFDAKKNAAESDELTKILDKLMDLKFASKKTTIKSGTKINTKSINATLSALNGATQQIVLFINQNAKFGNNNLTKNQLDCINIIKDFITYIAHDVDELIAASKKIVNNKVKSTKNGKAAEAKPVNESAIMKLRLLAEAYDLLNESDDADGAAVVAKDSETPEVAYDNIDDIPEKKPEVTPEYNSAVNGSADGKSEIYDDEDIKNIVNNNAEAIKILTDDTGSETVQEPADDDTDADDDAMLESIFGLDF